MPTAMSDVDVSDEKPIPRQTANAAAATEERDTRSGRGTMKIPRAHAGISNASSSRITARASDTADNRLRNWRPGRNRARDRLHRGATHLAQRSETPDWFA